MKRVKREDFYGEEEYNEFMEAKKRADKAYDRRYDQRLMRWLARGVELEIAQMLAQTET